MNKTAKQKRSKKSDKAKLAAGAKDIRKAEKESKAKSKKANKTAAPIPMEPVVIPESTRPIQQIIADRVTVLDGHIGLKLADDTPIEESLRVLDWTLQMSDHVGFMVGDVLNHGYHTWGEKYKTALNQTGLAESTLKGYSEAARRIPPEQRVASLSFTHHREVLRIGDDTKIAAVLKDAQVQAEKGHAPSTRELREKVKKMKPKKDTKVTSGKGKKRKAKEELPPYEPTQEQQAKLDQLEDLLGEAKDIVTSPDPSPDRLDIHDKTMKGVLLSLDNKEKERWYDILLPLVKLSVDIAKTTGAS